MTLIRTILKAVVTASMMGIALLASYAAAPIRVKVFVATMFEISANTGDRAGEFQHLYECYWASAAVLPVRGALKPVYCNADGVCGAAVGMGKVSSSASMQTILLNPQFDFSQADFHSLGSRRHAAVARYDRHGGLGNVAGQLRPLAGSA